MQTNFLKLPFFFSKYCEKNEKQISLSQYKILTSKQWELLFVMVILIHIFFNIRNVINQDTTGVVKYEALVKQIIERIFDGSKAELEDIEFRSHGIKDFLKTGFG